MPMPAAVDPRTLGERLESTAALDRLADPVHEAVTAALPAGPVKDALHGVWLGHPLHPLLTDLPIGFWTSAVVLDLLGGRRARPAADLLVGLGVLAAVPTAAAGLADWSVLDRPDRRTGIVHAAAGVTATTLFGLSLLARRAGRRGVGVALGLAGSGAASAGGFLGGHLTFRRGAGVNQTVTAPADDGDWNEVRVDGALSLDRPTLAHLGDEPLAAVDTSEGAVALYARCSHAGGPLEEGAVVDGCLECPWHMSRFRLRDGSVAAGPATAPQPAYELREHDGRTEARRRPTADPTA